MSLQLNLNNVIQAISIALLCWCGSTLYRLDKDSQLVEYRIRQIEAQTYHTDCKWCNHNHAQHGIIENKKPKRW